MRRLLSTLLAVTTMTLFVGCVYLRRLPMQPSHGPTTVTAGMQISWPNDGSARAAILGHADLGGTGDDIPVPIASIAKVMTALVLLRDYPLGDGDGFTLTVTTADVQDTAHRREQDQSLIPVIAGERLTERQALEALLIPSANNIAMMIAEHSNGTAAFVAGMNTQAKALGMLHTTYTDPSGFRQDTVSTAADQLKLLAAALRHPDFVNVVGRTHVMLPVAGIVLNTDTLLGRDGFIGVKTGSDDAAGGCFMFDSVQVLQGSAVHVIGVVLGQRHGPYIKAALNAAQQIVDSIAPQLTPADALS